MLPNKWERDSLEQGSRWPELRGLVVLRNERSAVGLRRDSEPWLPWNDGQWELGHGWLLSKTARISPTRMAFVGS